MAGDVAVAILNASQIEPTVLRAVAVQPFDEVTVTVYIPADRLPAVEEFCCELFWVKPWLQT